MLNQRLPYLLDQYLNKRSSGPELAEFYALVNNPANDLEFHDLLEEMMRKTGKDYKITPQEESKLLDFIFNQEELPQVKQVKMPRMHWKMGIAAAVTFLALSAGIYLLSNNYNGIGKTTVITSDVDPGGNKAVLTLANGRQVDLSKADLGAIAQQSGIAITKTKDGQLVYQVSGKESSAVPLMNTITTPRGGQYQVNLPDGTKIWLNATSYLKFPASFNGMKERRVELGGEAYFEVAKMNVKARRMPFIVVTANQNVEVLGTHFNIYAYADEHQTRTTLLEGAVRVQSLRNTKVAILEPGEESVLKEDDLKVQRADTEKSVAWKAGKFIFKKETLEEIMRKVSRWYDVEVVYESQTSKKETFSGTVSRFDKVSKVLRRLELTGEVNFKIEGRKITVLK